MDILALLVVFIGFIILKFMVKQNISFSLRVIAATIIGIIIGFIFKGHTDYAGMIGSIFAGLLSAMVVPLLFFSIISTITSLNSVGRLRTIGAKTIGILSLQNVLGSLIAIILAIIFNLGKGSKLAPPADAEVHEVPTIIDTIKGFFPTNIVSNAAENQVIPVIIFSLFIAIGVLTYKKDKEKIKPFVDFIHSANEVIFRVISIITDFTPYAVLALMANAISRIDIENMAPILVVLLCVYIAGLFHILVSTSLLISIIAKLSPIKFLKKFFPAQSVAFTTQSSVGSIPVNEECLENMGVSDNIRSFVPAIGSVAGMPGCAAIWPCLLALFTANSMGINYGFSDYLILIAVALLVSLGTVGVPGTATITATAVFATIGLPIEMIILMQPISAIADMMRTTTNVTSAGSTALIVASLENEIDREKFNS